MTVEINKIDDVLDCKYEWTIEIYEYLGERLKFIFRLKFSHGTNLRANIRKKHSMVQANPAPCYIHVQQCFQAKEKNRRCLGLEF